MNSLKVEHFFYHPQQSLWAMTNLKCSSNSITSITTRSLQTL